MCLKNYKIISLHKLQAFTLAEVLITLVVIGVIAALTVPALITNIQEAQYKTAWKKAYSDISQATSRITMYYGGTLLGAFPDTSSMLSKYSQYLNGIRVCGGSDVDGNCWHADNAWENIDGDKRQGLSAGILLANGAMLGFWTITPSSSCDEIIGNTTIQECGKFAYDVNGFKGPNVVGKDIFAVHILPNKVMPTGIQGDWDFITEEGWSISADYLKQ